MEQDFHFPSIHWHVFPAVYPSDEMWEGYVVPWRIKSQQNSQLQQTRVCARSSRVGPLGHINYSALSLTRSNIYIFFQILSTVKRLSYRHLMAMVCCVFELAKMFSFENLTPICITQVSTKPKLVQSNNRKSWSPLVISWWLVHHFEFTSTCDQVKAVKTGQDRCLGSQDFAICHAIAHFPLVESL